MRRARSVLLSILATVATTTVVVAPASPAAAGTLPWLPLGGDRVVGGLFQAGDPHAVTGPGYTTFRDSGLLTTGYTLRLVESPNVEEFRPELVRVAAEVSAMGVPVTVAPGRIAERVPNDGEILAMVSETAPCTGAWAGCGGAWYGGGPRAGVTYVSYGRIWIRSAVAAYSAHNQQHLVSHEAGHALGLDHHDPTFDDGHQVMHSSIYDAESFRQGDRNGIVYQRDRGAVAPTNDTWWWGRPDRTFTGETTSITGDYDPYAGDFNGDGRDDVLLYEPGSGPWGDHVLWGGPVRNQFASSDVSIAGVYTPLIGDFDADGRDDIFLYEPGSGPWGDHIMWGNANRTFTGVDTSVDGVYRPVVGDFDGDLASDIYWYEPGDGPWGDHIMWGVPLLRTFLSSDRGVSGHYQPVAGDFDGDGRDDIFWYEPGNGPWGDHMTWGGPLHTFTDTDTSVSGVYTLSVADFDGDSRDDVFLYEPGAGSWGDHVLWGRANRTFDGTDTAVNGYYEPAAGDFDGDGRADLLWYRAGDT